MNWQNDDIKTLNVEQDKKVTSKVNKQETNQPTNQMTIFKLVTCMVKQRNPKYCGKILTINLQSLIYKARSWKVYRLMLYWLLMNFWDEKWDPNTATPMEVCMLLQGELCWKVNLIWSHSMRVSWWAYELCSWPL